MSIWDDPELQTSDNFFKFENVGDTLQGRIDVIRRQRWEDGTMCPQLILTDGNGEEVTLTAGQIRLKAELVKQRPEVGDEIWIRLSNIERRTGGKTLKHFDVRIRRGQGAPAAAPAQAAGGFGGGQLGEPRPAAAPAASQQDTQPAFYPAAGPAAVPPPADDPWATPGVSNSPAAGGGWGGAPDGEPPF